MLSEHISFIIERVTDILKLEEEKEIVISDDVKKGIGELQKEMSRINKYYLRDVEVKYDNRQVLSEHEHQFYLYLNYLADSFDNILNRVTDNDDVASDVSHLVERIKNSYNSLSSQTIFNLNKGGTINLSGGQKIIVINDSEPLEMKHDSRPKSFGHYPDPDVVGFNHETETLLDHLIRPHDETMTSFVGIVGMGGLGKTTLAKHIYHHPKISTHFTHKAWVCISQSWDKTSILNSIRRQVTQEPTGIEMGYDQVVCWLYSFLFSRPYLIILDDIWSIDAWNHIRQAFPNKSRTAVVVTTRNKSLPQQIDPDICVVEPKLRDEESYELFKSKASHLDENTPNELLSLRMEMVKKCKCLPLAIIALVGVLRRDISQSSWERISGRILDMENDSTQGIVKETLMLSYYELPHPLKSCVLYLRLFPEDYEIKAKNLIQMWIAEGFVDDEFVGKEYLDEIAQRCIIQVVKTNYKGQVQTFRMHNLIRKMLVDKNQGREILKDTLRLAPSTMIFSSETNSHARSIIFVKHLDASRIYRNYSEPTKSLFVKFRLLRVLILSYLSIYDMLEEIGNLSHLRYLELGGSLEKLPESIGNLRNLWTLNIKEAIFYKVNRNNLYKLKELRHLYLPKERRGWEEIEVMKKWKLKTLWYARGGEWMLSGMLELSAVLQELFIRDIETKEQLETVFRTPSITSNNLHTLELMWSSRASFCDMSMLRDCKSLNKLMLLGKIGVSTLTMFPPNLIKLEMGYTNSEESQVMNIISKSCPLLRILVLRSNAYMGSKLVCNANSFPQLTKLKLEDLNNLKLWTIKESAMPRLHHLEITSCKNLHLYRQGWARILKIPQLKCTNLSTKFHEKLRSYKNDGIDLSSIE